MRRGVTGAEWVLRSLNQMGTLGTLGERLNAVTAATIARQAEGKPVVDWPLAGIEEGGGWKHTFHTVEQYMTTDLFTVHQDEPVELVANLMDWERIRHVPVEDNQHHLVGLISYRMLIRLLANRSRDDRPRSVSEIMRKGESLVTIPPETTTVQALKVMRDHNVGCLPVVKNERLVGIVTQRDFMDVARDLLAEKLEELDPAEA